jgi:hypothetical protein
MTGALILGSLLAVQSLGTQAPARLQVFLDCPSGCYADFVRDEIKFVDFVRDRTNADIHALISVTETGAGGREYAVSMIGARAFTGTDRSLKAVTGPSDTEDMQRRHVLNTVRVALLQYVARDGMPQNLSVDVRVATPAAGAVARQDRWNSWVFSLRGSASFEGEESNTQRELAFEGSADRITENWKTTFGADFEQEKEEFEVDDDEPVEVDRHSREFDWLVVKGLGEHWSLGARGSVESSTFDNTKIRYAGAPAVEYNFFPYSAYTRRQLRTLYAVGVRHQKYYEETLYLKLEETLPEHEISVTYEQREPWGSVEGRLEWTQFLNDLSKYRLEANGELSWRIVRGFSISAFARASRVRDQVSLRRRGATQEEILLELRELQSGYQYDFSVSLTYTFGSIFSSIVNPRFGQ